jgi:hypothetical protein
MLSLAGVFGRNPPQPLDCVGAKVNLHLKVDLLSIPTPNTLSLLSVASHLILKIIYFHRIQTAATVTAKRDGFTIALSQYIWKQTSVRVQRVDTLEKARNIKPLLKSLAFSAPFFRIKVLFDIEISLVHLYIDAQFEAYFVFCICS